MALTFDTILILLNLALRMWNIIVQDDVIMIHVWCAPLINWFDYIILIMNKLQSKRAS